MERILSDFRVNFNGNEVFKMKKHMDPIKKMGASTLAPLIGFLAILEGRFNWYDYKKARYVPLILIA